MSAPDPVRELAIPSVTPRRVLMAVDAVGGVWRYALDLASGLRAQGIETCLCVLGPAPSAGSMDEARQCCAGVESFPCRLEWMTAPWADVAASGQWLLALAGRWDPDVVHLNGYTHASLDWGRPVAVVAHSCVATWWRAVHGLAVPAEWDEYRTRVGRGLRHADVVIAPSAAMAAGLATEYGFAGSIQVIPNGRSLPTAASREKERFVFSAGRLWDAGKNAQALCAAAENVRWPVFVAGDASGEGTADVALDSVHHLGTLSPCDVQAWMARAPIYAHPACYEPFGLSVLEAAAAGCALVLGDIPSLRENWDDVAVFVPPHDPDALADAINRLIDDESLRVEAMRRARQRSDAFPVTRMAAAYAASYATAMATAARRDLSLVRS